MLVRGDRMGFTEGRTRVRLRTRYSCSFGTPAPSVLTQFNWLALAAMASIMLLAVTNHVTQNIASVPFLWVLPLSIYLVSFILTFDHPRWYQRGLFIAALSVLAPTMAWLIPSLELVSAAAVFPDCLSRACSVTANWRDEARSALAHAVLFDAVRRRRARSHFDRDRRAARVTRIFEVNIALILLALTLSLRLRGAWRLIGLAVFTVTAFFHTRGARVLRNVRVMERDFYGVVARATARSGAVSLDASRRNRARRPVAGQ